MRGFDFKSLPPIAVRGLTSLFSWLFLTRLCWPNRAAQYYLCQCWAIVVGWKSWKCVFSAGADPEEKSCLRFSPSFSGLPPALPDMGGLGGNVGPGGGPPFSAHFQIHEPSPPPFHRQILEKLPRKSGLVFCFIAKSGHHPLSFILLLYRPCNFTQMLWYLLPWSLTTPWKGGNLRES